MFTSSPKNLTFWPGFAIILIGNYAEVVKLADAHGSGPCGSNPVWVRIPPSAHISCPDISGWLFLCPRIPAISHEIILIFMLLTSTFELTDPPLTPISEAACRRDFFQKPF